MTYEEVGRKHFQIAIVVEDAVRCDWDRDKQFLARRFRAGDRGKIQVPGLRRRGRICDMDVLDDVVNRSRRVIVDVRRGGGKSDWAYGAFD